MRSRYYTFGLSGLIVFCVALAVAVGMAGRWRVRQLLPKASVRDAWCVEGDPLSFAVELSEESKTRIVLRIATRNSTASAGDDYLPILSTTVTFEPGETQKYVAVETRCDDDEDEGDETLFLELVDASGAAFEFKPAIGTIGDGLPPVDVAITRFYGDGKDLRIDYTVQSELSGDLTFEVMVSYDGTNGGPAIGQTIGPSSRGRHSATLHPEFGDLEQDYWLVAFVDTAYDETDRENNFARFAGGAFLSREPASGKSVLHLHGSERADLTGDFAWQAADEVHFRGHGGDDNFNLDAFRPGAVGWLFGGEGEDQLVGSSAGDRLFGGPKHDILHGGGGNDMLVGGLGQDELHGGGGEDELYGGPDKDSLFDTDEDTTFDGGPGQDLFNRSSRNPAVAPVDTAARDFYRGAEDDRALRIDLASGFPAFIESFPEHEWKVECRGAAIADWSVTGDVLRVEFNTGVPEDSLINVSVAARADSQAKSSTAARTEQLSLHVYSISVTGFKVERRTGPRESDWIEEQGDLWSSDTVRWTPLYEPKQVPIQWKVEWVSKPAADEDHPHVAWEVFATGPKPICSPPGGVRTITPRFVFGEGR